MSDVKQESLANAKLRIGPKHATAVHVWICPQRRNLRQINARNTTL